MKAKMIDFERMVDEHCNIEYAHTNGEEFVRTSKASLMIAFEEYLKLCDSKQFITANTDKANVCGHPKDKVWRYNNKTFCESCNNWLTV